MNNLQEELPLELVVDDDIILRVKKTGICAGALYTNSGAKRLLTGMVALGRARHFARCAGIIAQAILQCHHER